LLGGLNTIDDACGNDPSWVCQRVFEATDNAALAAAADWAVTKPIAIFGIVLLALVVSRIARWTIKRVMQRVLQPQNAERARKIRALSRSNRS